MCELRSCGEGITCLIGCISIGGGGGGGLPIDIACALECASLLCPDSRFFFNQVVECAIGAFIGGSCMDPSCLFSECSSEIAACMMDRTSC